MTTINNRIRMRGSQRDENSTSEQINLEEINRGNFSSVLFSDSVHQEYSSQTDQGSLRGRYQRAGEGYFFPALFFQHQADGSPKQVRFASEVLLEDAP